MVSGPGGGGPQLFSGLNFEVQYRYRIDFGSTFEKSTIPVLDFEVGTGSELKSNLLLCEIADCEDDSIAPNVLKSRTLIRIHVRHI